MTRHCLKEPTRDLHNARRYLEQGAAAHLEGDAVSAESYFLKADSLEVFFWLNPAWYHVHRNVTCWRPQDDTGPVPHENRDPHRNICAAVKREVLARDGYRCRYCGLPVIAAEIRKLLHQLYPHAVRWDPSDLRRQHAAFAAMWLQYDHVVPHSHGGRSDADNVVVACALCNFGKHGYTIKQLGITDPRERDSVRLDWDGLERVRQRQVPSE